MQKIPQAVAMILLIGALTVGDASAQGVRPSGKGAVAGSTAVRAQAEISSLLHEFLSRVNDPAMHDRFWASDLVYVGATGVVRTKPEIMKSVREAAAKGANYTDKDSYGAEDVQVRQYGNVAVLDFKLVAHSGNTTDYYRNSGTFVKRNGKWQAVNWQATKIEPPKPEAAKKPTGKE